jgi:hypothetical protein
MSSDLSKQKGWDDENNCLSLRHFFFVFKLNVSFAFVRRKVTFYLSHSNLKKTDNKNNDSLTAVDIKKGGLHVYCLLCYVMCSWSKANFNIKYTYRVLVTVLLTLKFAVLDKLKRTSCFHSKSLRRLCPLLMLRSVFQCRKSIHCIGAVSNTLSSIWIL